MGQKQEGGDSNEEEDVIENYEEFGVIREEVIHIEEKKRIEVSEEEKEGENSGDNETKSETLKEKEQSKEDEEKGELSEEKKEREKGVEEFTDIEDWKVDRPKENIFKLAYNIFENAKGIVLNIRPYCKGENGQPVEINDDINTMDIENFVNIEKEKHGEKEIYEYTEEVLEKRIDKAVESEINANNEEENFEDNIGNDEMKGLIEHTRIEVEEGTKKLM